MTGKSERRERDAKRPKRERETGDSDWRARFGTHLRLERRVEPADAEGGFEEGQIPRAEPPDE